ncbi:glycosyltransferase [Lithospermum erythrorhizon]|uniref:Glycosyltransferase n=1 Tax=Lithospermum erythrorhizon TaxID=34254 RepID=A0AAV3P4Y1_LITER
MSSLSMEKKWVFPLVLGSMMCIFLLRTSFNFEIISAFHTFNSMFSIIPSHIMVKQTSLLFAESKINHAPDPPVRPLAPRFAYLISGSKGDLEKLWRTLQTLYHPRNYYVVHLDLESPAKERLELASRVEKDAIFAKVGNVHMIKKANIVTYRGPTMVANTLHACSILLKKFKDWDWFINLSASDYPLVTQDDIIHTFTGLNLDLNFIEHSSHLGWKLDHRAMPLIIDPGLYQTNKSEVFRATPKRRLPTAFKLFTGSAWMILSRAFVEYCVWGWDSLPRTLLMYYSNFASSPEGYFHTVVCNSPQFVPTVVNHDMHYISWDFPPKQHPRTLSLNDTTEIIASGAAFARKFKQDDPVLDMIDNELLGRRNGRFTPGGWCEGSPDCSKVGNPSKIQPGPGAQRLSRLIEKFVFMAKFNQNQCI